MNDLLVKNIISISLVFPSPFPTTVDKFLSFWERNTFHYSLYLLETNNFYTFQCALSVSMKEMLMYTHNALCKWFSKCINLVPNLEHFEYFFQSPNFNTLWIFKVRFLFPKCVILLKGSCHNGSLIAVNTWLALFSAFNRNNLITPYNYNCEFGV